MRFCVLVNGGAGSVDGSDEDGQLVRIEEAFAAVVGVLPLGTFDHFAKDLGIPTDLTEAAASLVSGEERQVDIGEVNGRVFVNNSAPGVHPAMVAVRDRIRDQRGWGKIRAVPVAAVRVLRAFPVHRFDLRSHCQTGSPAPGSARPSSSSAT